jgi:cytochrome c oxidase cbb3-type subunit III
VTTSAAVLLVATLLVACDRLPGRPRQEDRPLRPHEVMGFAQLYGENCAGCHGVSGILGPATALANPMYQAWADDAALRRAITQGVPGTSMPAFAISGGGWLTDAQIDALIHEMRTQWTTTPTPSGLPPYAGDGGGDVGRGGTLFAQRCGGCHDPNGKGTPRGGSVTDAAYLTLVSDQALRTAVVAGRPDLGMPDWRSATPWPPLAPQQVSDLVAWMASHRKGGA